MKRLAAILMLVVLLFNSIGYRIVSYILEKQADINLEMAFDANLLDESQLVEIKIPIKLPYQTEWKEFERYDGEVKVKGVYYKYVKRKVIVDTLVLLCMPNNTKLAFESARDRLFELIDHLKLPVQKKGDSVFKNLISDYIHKNYSPALSPLWTESVPSGSHFSVFISSIYLEKPIKPPEFELHPDAVKV